MNPVNDESVPWITELKNTLSGFFFFGAMQCFLRFEERHQSRWYLLALLCGACALLSKASTVVLPAALLLCVWWQHGRCQPRDIGRIAPFLILASLMALLAIVEQRGHIARQGTTEWSLGPGAAADRRQPGNLVLSRQACLARGPGLRLSALERGDNDGHVVRGTRGCAGGGHRFVDIAATAVRRLLHVSSDSVSLWWRCCRVLGFVDVFYFRYSFVADHFQYLAGVGVVACAASGITCVLDRGRPSLAPVRNIVYTALLATLAVLTWRQCQIYHDPKTLWRDTLARNPDAWMVHYNLGEALWQTGQREEAITQYEQALDLNPDSAEAHFNLGVALVQVGRLPGGRRAVRGGLADQNPITLKPTTIWGTCCGRWARLRGPCREYGQAVRIKPDYAKAHTNLGVALVRVGRFREATEQYEQVLQLTPNEPSAHFNLAGTALLQLGKPADAAAQFAETLQLKPG